MKTLIIKIFAAVCLLALSSTDLFSFTVKWKVKAGSWEDIYIYAWDLNDDSKIFGDWPGRQVIVDDDGWYSVSIQDGLTAGAIINKGPYQARLGDMAPLSTSICYHVDLTTSTYSQIDCSTEDTIVTPAYTIRWKVTAGAWDEMFIYTYDGNPDEIFGQWPGQQVSLGDDGWYSATIPAGQAAGKAVFNNNKGLQLPPSEGEDGISVMETVCLALDLEQMTSTKIDCNATGMENIQSKDPVVFSTPSGKLEIQSEKKIANVTNYNLLGSRVINAKEASDYLNISQLATGMYLVDITFADGSSYNQKIRKK
jgi:hypothetical protein